MSNQTFIERNETGVFDEVSKQVSTQSAVLAGFAFASLTIVSYDASAPGNLSRAFAICTSLTVILELLALFVSGVLPLFGRMLASKDDPEFLYTLEMNIMWLAYFAGLISFLIAVVLLAWIKIRLAALTITVMVSIAALAMVLLFIRIIVKYSRAAT